ncbi:aminopeptidase [Candidatus Woesearchaeota archaeon]|nr:aminopeptidase [Candidatus Woesearchaeota archaeon]
MGTIKEGANQALKNCLKLKRNEAIIIITDNETLEIGVAFLTEAKKITKDVDFFILEDFGKRPLKTVPEEILTSIKKVKAGIYAGQGKEGELQSFRRPLLKETEKHTLRFANMVNINQTIMEQGMCADYEKIREFSQRLYNIILNAREINVKTEAGTDFTVSLSTDMRWVNADGIISKVHWSNLPDGEIYTCPKDTNGKVVIDGVLGDYFASKYGLLANTPLLVEIHENRVISARCSNTDLEDDFKGYIRMDENSSRVGEFAFGTNMFITKLIGQMLQDEKFPGVHIAFGHGYPERTGCSWTSKAHLDAVIIRPTVTVDGRKIMEKGVYMI